MTFDDIRCLIGKTGTAQKNTAPYQKGFFVYGEGIWVYECGAKVNKGDELLVKNVDSNRGILFVVKKNKN